MLTRILSTFESITKVASQSNIQRPTSNVTVATFLAPIDGESVHEVQLGPLVMLIDFVNGLLIAG